MKKKVVLGLFVFVLVIIIGILYFEKNHIGDIMDGPGMVNDVSSYSVETKERLEIPGEDIYVYDIDGNLIFSLEDNNQPQYLFAIYENYLILDSGTNVSQRDFLVYDVESKNKLFETDYYPGKFGLVLNDNIINFYKKVDESVYGNLPECENMYDNGYIENYEYTIGENQANGLGDIQCAYFE